MKYANLLLVLSFFMVSSCQTGMNNQFPDIIPKPASLIVGDNPGLFSYGANEESFKETGLMEAA